MKKRPPYTYTEGDIRRYHSGAMPEGERHLLELAALEDPFLADALEGYGAPGGGADDLPGLKAAIERRMAPPRRMRKLPYLAAAAVLLLAAFGAWWLMPGEKELAPSVAQTAPSAPAQAEAVQAERDPAPVPADTTEAVASPAQETAAPRRSFTSPLRKTEDREVRSSPAADTAFLAAPATLPPPAVVLKSTPRGDSLEAVVLQAQPMELQEIVIGNSTASRRRSALTPAAAAVIADTLEPVTGWTDFEAYVIDRLSQGRALTEETQQGTVRLSFDISKTGTPVNIRVEESLCPSCDEAAIRLLLEGPKWKKRTRNRARISIRF